MKNKENQSIGECDILQNPAGEILIIMSARPGGPEQPRFVYDGGPKAILYRSKDNAIILNDITQPARTPIKTVTEVMIVEVDGDDVLREYTAPVRVIKDLETLAQTIIA